MNPLVSAVRVPASPTNSLDVLYSFPKTKIRVLLLENIHKSAVACFESETFQVECVPKALSEDELVKRIDRVHILGIRSKTKVSKTVLSAAKRLLAIGCFCIGTDQVALADAELLGIPVFNAPFSNTRSVAELVLAELIALSRKLVDRSRDMHDGVWNKSANGCSELRGKFWASSGMVTLDRSCPCSLKGLVWMCATTMCVPFSRWEMGAPARQWGNC